MTETKPKTTPRKKAAKSAMSDDHKAALAQGREQGRAVRLYLEAITQPKPRGRQVPIETKRQRLAEAQDLVNTSTGLAKLEAAQAVVDLTRDLEAADATSGPDLAELEAAFVAVAAAYAERKGVSREAFRTVGVPAKVLKAAGI